MTTRTEFRAARIPAARWSRVLALLLTGWPLLVSAVRFEFFEPVRPPRAVQVMAHRGAAGQAPENTRPALMRCIEDGLEWAEIDLRRTRDGRHVVWHDSTFERLGRPEGRIQELTLTELKAVDAGRWFAPRYAGERMLEFREALDLARGRLNLYLDCKDVDVAQVVREIREAAMQRQVVVFADQARLAEVRTLAGHDIAIMAKWRPADGFEGWVGTLNPDAVEIDATEVQRADVDRLHALGIKVQAKTLGTADGPESWDRVVAAGVDWIQTDLAEEFVARRVRALASVKGAPVLVSLHRGASRYAPENTLDAFTKAFRLGADYVEFDVRTTRDGGLVLLHDGRLDRTTEGRGPVANRTLEEVGALDAGAWFGPGFRGRRVPTLESFLGALPPGVTLYLDAKDIAPEVLVSAVNRHDLAGRTVVYQSADYLVKLRRLDSRIRALPPLRRIEDLDSLVERLPPFAVDVPWRALSRPLIDRCHARGIKVFSDALDENEKVESYREAIAWGVDLIQTDHPLRVYRAIELVLGTDLRRP